MTDLINQAFISAAGAQATPSRIDGRQAGEFRKPLVRFGPLNGHAQVTIGSTVVAATIVGEITPPAMERPNEGRLFFSVDLGQVANPAVYEYGRPTPEATSLCNYVERVLRGSKAIDVESLCILGGRSVWSVRCDLHVLNDGGSLADACSLAALSSLLNFRHDAVCVDGETASVFTENARDPVPLSIHHMPVSATFAVFSSKEGLTWFADPATHEESALGSILSLTVNQHGELCGIHMPGGIPIDQSILSECAAAAIQHARDVSDVIKAELHNHRITQSNSGQKRKRD